MVDNFDTQLGQKLKKAREKLGMTQEEVRTKMGFENYQTLSSIENGSRKIKAQELAKLAKIYFRDVAYFLSAEEQEEDALVFWRECPHESIAKIKEQEFLKFCYNYYDLEKRLNLEHGCSLKPLDYKPDDFDFEKIEEMAEDFYNRMKLGSRPACSLRKILEEQFNIKIFYYDVGDRGSAASAIGKFGTAILINATEALWRRNFDLAHELFHVLTWNTFKHDEIHRNDGEKSIIEQWADAFAAGLLLPQIEVSREFKNKIEDGKIALIDVVGIAREFEVSTEALMWRLVTLNLLQRNTVKDVLGSKEFKEINKTERAKDHRKAPDISEKYISLAFKAYAKDLITKGKLAEYLNINISDVGKKLAEHGYNLEEIYNAELAAA